MASSSPPPPDSPSRAAAVVTGASSGIGLEPARQCPMPGATETEFLERADTIASVLPAGMTAGQHRDLAEPASDHRS